MFVFVLSNIWCREGKEKNGAGKKERSQRASRICHRADKNWAEYNLTECTKRRAEWSWRTSTRRWSGFPLLQSLPHSRRPSCSDGQLSPLVIFYMFSPPTEISARDHISQCTPTLPFLTESVTRDPHHRCQPLKTPHCLTFSADYASWCILAFALSRKTAVATPWHRRRDAMSLFYLIALSLSLFQLTNLYIQIWFLK